MSGGRGYSRGGEKRADQEVYGWCNFKGSVPCQERISSGERMSAYTADRKYRFVFDSPGPLQRTSMDRDSRPLQHDQEISYSSRDDLCGYKHSWYEPVCFVTPY